MRSSSYMNWSGDPSIDLERDKAKAMIERELGQECQLLRAKKTKTKKIKRTHARADPGITIRGLILIFWGRWGTGHVQIALYQLYYSFSRENKVRKIKAEEPYIILYSSFFFFFCLYYFAFVDTRQTEYFPPSKI